MAVFTAIYNTENQLSRQLAKAIYVDTPLVATCTASVSFNYSPMVLHACMH